LATLVSGFRVSTKNDDGDHEVLNCEDGKKMATTKQKPPIPESNTMRKLRERSIQQSLNLSIDEIKNPICDADRKKRRASTMVRGSARFVRRRVLTEIRLRWSLMRPWSQMALLFLTLFLTVHLVVGTIDMFFHYYGLKNASVEMRDESAFAVVINTFKRPKQLKLAVRHYAQTCGKPAGVSQVFVIWCEEADPPDPESFFDNDGNVRGGSSSQQDRDRRATIRMVRSPNSLNSRFVPIPDLKSKAIFMVDDDVQVDCFGLHQGFLAWKSYPFSTVGYYPRLASSPRSAWWSSATATGSGGYIEHTWPIVFLRQQVNFILTKACFLHERYMALYSSDEHHPKEIRDYVDKYMNCEDVAMSLLVANFTRAERGRPATPVFVEGRVSDAGLFNGISTGSGFVERRAACLTDLTAIYEKHGWEAPLNYTYSLREASWVQHVPGLRWQARPSNPFEWGALLDFFK